MKNVIDISTGEVKMGTGDRILVSNGIGSCIVIVGINLKKGIGAVAHVMLPGQSPANENQNKTKYAKDAVDRLLYLLQAESGDTSQIKTCLVGAGNVLKKKDDTICKNNIESVSSILESLHIQIDASSLGGIKRRSVRFDVEKRKVHITKGDSELRLLKCWR